MATSGLTVRVSVVVLFCWTPTFAVWGAAAAYGGGFSMPGCLFGSDLDFWFCFGVWGLMDMAVGLSSGGRWGGAGLVLVVLVAGGGAVARWCPVGCFS